MNFQEIKDSHDIVDVISNYVDIKKRGKDYFGCCPFHNEKTPSFSVNQSKQYYHCFGCGESGDVIDFVRNHLNVNHTEAVKILTNDSSVNYEKSKYNRIKNAARKIILPFNKKPLDSSVISNFLSKCSVFSNPLNGNQAIYMYGGKQVILLTDIHKRPVTISLISGHEKPVFYNKEFIFGSCAVYGEIKDKVYLVEDIKQAIRLHNIRGLNVVCYFKALNLFYIQDELKRLKVNFDVVPETEESYIQADKFNLNIVSESNV